MHQLVGMNFSQPGIGRNGRDGKGKKPESKAPPNKSRYKMQELNWSEDFHLEMNYPTMAA
jgi:hypothetical protein